MTEAEFVPSGGCTELLEGGAVGVCAGIGGILETGCDRQLVRLAVLLDLPHLVFDGAARLVVGAVPRIGGCGFCLHENSSLNI